MGMTGQADALGVTSTLSCDLAGDGLVAGLDVVALVGDVAGDADAAVADQARWYRRQEELRAGGGGTLSYSIHRAVAVGGAMQGVTSPLGGIRSLNKPVRTTLLRSARMAEEQYLLVQGGGRSYSAVGAGPGWPCPGRTAGQQVTGLTHGLRAARHGPCRGDGAEADQVLDHAGEGRRSRSCRR
ncbi:hypothetical protein ACRFBT_26560 [Pseudomonas aeruginosa]|uniref:hypothetical protein n=1 Tax=Pseudomonas aeruginosa TaxID=287 RepID=UPI003D6EF638